MSDINEQHITFLRQISAGKPIPLATREQDRIRQRVRRDGLAEMRNAPRRWALTDKGRVVLAFAALSPEPQTP